MQRVPCPPWDKRLPHLDELDTELTVPGVSMHKDQEIKVDSLAASHLTFKKELLQVLPTEDSAFKFKTCAVVGNSVRRAYTDAQQTSFHRKLRCFQFGLQMQYHGKKRRRRKGNVGGKRKNNEVL